MIQVDGVEFFHLKNRIDPSSGRIIVIAEHERSGSLELNDSHKIEIKWLNVPPIERKWQEVGMKGLLDAMVISGVIPKYVPGRDVSVLPSKAVEPQVSKVAKKLMRAWEKGRGNADKLQRKLDKRR